MWLPPGENRIILQSGLTLSKEHVNANISIFFADLLQSLHANFLALQSRLQAVMVTSCGTLPTTHFGGELRNVIAFLQH